MAFKIPSLSETRDFLLAVGKALFIDRNYGNLRSYHSKRATFLSAAVTQLHAHIKSALDDAMPDTAPDDGPIQRWGKIIGVVQKGATGARKSGAGRVMGTNGTPVPLDEELVHDESGLRFKVAVAAVVPAAGFVDVDIAAIDTGEQTRLLKGIVLKFVATPAGLETEVVLQKDLDEDGYDLEQFGAYRRRVLDAFATPTSGGSQSDFAKWGLEVTGVDQMYVYPNRAGLGTVDIVGLHSASGIARELSGGEQTELVNYIRTKAPAHIAGSGFYAGGAFTGAPTTLRHLDIVADTQNVEIVLTPDGQSANAFDWSGGPMIVLAWTAGTRTLQFTTVRPATMQAGHRIVIKGVGSAQLGEELKIESLSGADAVVLEKAPAVAPVATDTVYSGGPLVTPVRDAILAHMNGERVYAAPNRIPKAENALDSTVRLDVISDGIGPANPAGVYGTWIGGLIRNVLGQIAMYKGGVRNINIVSPAADYDATDDVFPFDTQIHMIVPGYVIIRGAS